MDDLCVEFLYMWVRRGTGADGVSFNNEKFGGFSEVRYHVGNVIFQGGMVRPSQQKVAPQEKW